MTAVDPAIGVGARNLTASLGRWGDATAIIAAGRSLSYEALNRRVDDVVGRLGPERRLVALAVDNSVESVVTYLAALRGEHPVALVAAGDDRAMAAVRSSYDPDIVATGGHIETLRDRSSHDLHPDLAVMLSTSGSTGTPKLARLSHANLVSNAAAIGQALAIDAADRAITTLPLQYCYGLSVINSYLTAGASVVLNEFSVVDPCFWALAREHRVTSFAGVPHTFELLDRIGFTGDELPSLRYLTQAGGGMEPERVRRYADLGARKGFELFVMYGQTEATARMAYLPPHLAAAAPDAIGVAVPDGALRVDAPGPDGVGELVYAGPNVMMGYAETPADLALGASLTELRTGDLARRADDGLFRIVGRASRFIKPFGVRIDLDHLERELAARGFTALCTGDDGRLVVGGVGASAAALAVAVDDVVRLPARCVAVVALHEKPLLPTGKTDYAAVRTAASQSDPVGDASGATGATRVRTVSDAFMLAVGAAPQPDDTFIGMGGDSLSYVEVSLWLEELIGDVPRDWHAMPVALLEARRQTKDTTVRRAWATTDTTVALRAAFIVLIVGTHTGLWHQQGGAHALLALAGYNFARFQLTSGTLLRSVARVAVPSMLWIGAIAVVSEKLGWPHALLVNDVLGREDSVWSYWFIEAIVQISLPLAAVFSLARMRAFERAQPFFVAALAVAVGLVARFDLVPSPTDHLRTWPHEIFWLFALGWAAARATAHWQRALVTAVALATVPGFFDNGARTALVVGAISLAIWSPRVALPRPLRRVVTPIAGASLYIYLTHIQLHPALGRSFGPVIAALGSLAFGVGAWRVGQRIEGWVLHRARRPHGFRCDRNGEAGDGTGDAKADRERNHDVV